MRILSMMWLLALGLVLISIQSNAQRNDADTGKFNPLRVDIKNTSIGLRVGTGIQGSFWYEIGLARNSFIGSSHGVYGRSLYAVFASFPAFRGEEATASGFRVGADLYSGGGLLGLEVSNFWAGRQQDVLIAPKIGIGFTMLSAFMPIIFQLMAGLWLALAVMPSDCSLALAYGIMTS